MLIRPADMTLGDDEWRTFLQENDFGQLIAAGVGRTVPVIVPTHFVYDGNATILLHLARPNPIWDALAENEIAVMAIVGAYTYIPTQWNANPGQAVEYGVPTSYYAAVQVSGPCRIVDDPSELAAILTMQVGHFQPQGGHAPIAADDSPYGRQLPGIRGIHLTITDVLAKFKFGGNKQVPHRLEIAEHLRQRDRPFDTAARHHLLRRTSRQDVQI